MLLSDLDGWDQLADHPPGLARGDPGPVDRGRRFLEVVSVMNMANKIEWTVAEVEAPKFLRITGTGMAGVTVEFALKVEQTETGSDRRRSTPASRAP